MPIYEYRCEKGHSFEILQRMADEPMTACTTCDAKVQRVMHPVAIHFKGSGFYTTDYARKGRGSGGDSDAKKNGSDAGDSASKGESGSKGEGRSKGDKSESSSSAKTSSSD